MYNQNKKGSCTGGRSEVKTRDYSAYSSYQRGGRIFVLIATRFVKEILYEIFLIEPHATPSNGIMGCLLDLPRHKDVQTWGGWSPVSRCGCPASRIPASRR